MKFRSRQTMLCLIMLFCSGCAFHMPDSLFQVNELKKASNLENKSIIVVPFKGTATGIASTHKAAFFFGGIIGNHIANKLALEKPELEVYCEKLNAAAAKFVAEQIIAEEAVDLLKHSSRNVNAIMLHRGSEIVPGTESWIDKFPRPFSITFDPRTKMAHEDWLSGVAGKDPVVTDLPNEQFIALEVSVGSSLSDKNDLYLTAYIKLVDPVSGNVLASGSAFTSGNVHLLNKEGDLELFIADFRKSARRAAEKCLKGMKVIE
ncbi:MAG: hypothetical protein HQL23_01630 [Candidatus Omnitrophica bacterium]|nr:hypothetical protein [Candidatus Omnitrophota bacterium]